MDQPGHGQPPAMGMVGSAAQMPYGIPPFQPNQMVGTSGPGTVGSIQSPTQPAGISSPAQLAQHQLAYQHIHQQQQQQLQQQLQNFWQNQYQEIEQTTDFKNHSLPLARIKKIMKADEDVRMISAEAPVIFARACEMFILELTLRSWNHTEENKRRTLQKNDIAAAITRTDIFDFLVDIVPREDLKDEHGPQVGAPGMVMGKTVMDQGLYGQQPRPYVAQQMWPQQQQQQPPADS
ncbi:Nuclear transcription factor Y subunit C-3 [Vitis vinifera]|uniref:Nuclear transcription factor Y subunit C-3 n=1 Tax=Vitis vinifera TaxID=29760 RepID=A0A438KKH7_VITVI|nr:Nuclear transcription factor Y subunit C-3 [Vitis vinifera]